MVAQGLTGNPRGRTQLARWRGAVASFVVGGDWRLRHGGGLLAPLLLLRLLVMVVAGLADGGVGVVRRRSKMRRRG